jgi:hypothetical protein
MRIRQIRSASNARSRSKNAKNYCPLAHSVKGTPPAPNSSERLSHLLEYDRLGRVSRYTGSIRTSATANNRPVSVRSAILPHSDQITLQDIFDAIRMRDLATIDDETEAFRVAAGYFKRVHTWFPIIDLVWYYEQLSNFRNQQRADFRLLSFCIFLTGAIPDQGELTSQTLSLYTSTRSFRFSGYELVRIDSVPTSPRDF